jgi:hypothetical protein
MSIRRNFIHNCITHPVCGLIWLAADLIGLAGCAQLKDRLVNYGEQLHADTAG